MKRLLYATIVMALLWAGYWFVAKTGLQKGFESWFSARQTEGWVADYSDLKVAGFPNRLDTTFTELSLADPETGLAWDAPFFQILALSYKPYHVIAVWPDEHVIATPLGKYRVASNRMQASMVVDPDTSLALNRTNLVADMLRISENGADTVALNELRAGITRSEDTNSYRFGIEAKNLSPTTPFRLQVDPANLLPASLSKLSMDMTIAFDRPWDRFAIENARPQPTQIDLKLAEANWGELQLAAAGQVTVNAMGVGTGRITVKARNWRDILSVAVASGMIPASFAKQLESGLSLLSQLSGNEKTLDIPLDLRGGQMWLGPIPIGQAPIFRLR